MNQAREQVVFILDERRAERDGRDIRLTPLETSIIQVLLAANGQAVPWARVAAQPVWETWETGEIRETLRVHMRHLRMKLGADVVVTVPGVGYRIGDEHVARCVFCGRVS